MAGTSGRPPLQQRRQDARKIGDLILQPDLADQRQREQKFIDTLSPAIALLPAPQEKTSYHRNQ